MKRTLLISMLAITAVAASAAFAGGMGLPLGPASHATESTFKGYYDGHKDVYLVTDVSSKAQATALKVNYAPVLKKATGAPPQYFIEGRAAKGQIAVFGSEPGEMDYNPLWIELIVRWKAGVTPVLLVKDDQISALAKKHKLTITNPHIVLNAPIVKIEK
jgi:hypothetical protein